MVAYDVLVFVVTCELAKSVQRAKTDQNISGGALAGCKLNVHWPLIPCEHSNAH